MDNFYPTSLRCSAIKLCVHSIISGWAKRHVRNSDICCSSTPSGKNWRPLRTEVPPPISCRCSSLVSRWRQILRSRRRIPRSCCCWSRSGQSFLPDTRDGWGLTTQYTACIGNTDEITSNKCSSRFNCEVLDNCSKPVVINYYLLYWFLVELTFDTVTVPVCDLAN